MSVQKRWNDEIPADTAALGDVLLEPDDPYRLVGQEASHFFTFEDFVSLYKPIGRGAICPIAYHERQSDWKLTEDEVW